MKALPLYQAEAKERQEAAGSRGNEGGRGNKKPETLPAKTQEGFSFLPKKARGRVKNESSYQAAKAAGVGRRTVSGLLRDMQVFQDNRVAYT